MGTFAPPGHRCRCAKRYRMTETGVRVEAATLEPRRAPTPGTMAR
jgi:hypothetical protein